MAKKQKAEMAAEEPVMVAPSKKEKPKNSWEYKDRQYYLLGDNSPVAYVLKSKNIMWFDEKLGFEREIRYTLNQKTVFVDEFKGEARLDHIIFRDGVLNVPKEKVVLQKILSIYHPAKNRVYKEVDEKAAAMDDLQVLNLEFEAMSTAMNLDIDHAEAIVRTERGSDINNMTSQEVKRDLFVMAKQNPELFLELANDENISIRNMGIRAVETGILILDSDQRTFSLGSNNRKLFTTPFDENPYSALTSYFKTDDGIELYQAIEKKLK
jgi:hypothetical protein